MKNKFSLILALLLSLMVSCEENHLLTEENIFGLEAFLDRYFNMNYDYPASLEDLLSFCQSDNYLIQTMGDSYNSTMLSLTNNKERISWILDDGFIKEHLLILNNKDTLIHRINDRRFPCGYEYLTLYENCYLSDPRTPEDFISFIEDRLSKADSLWRPDKCDSLTLTNFIKCKERDILKWVWFNDDFYIIVNQDTICSRRPSFTICDKLDYYLQTRRPHFYDQDGYYIAESNESVHGFFSGIQSLSKDFQIVNSENNIHVLEFDIQTGLHCFCENDSFDINNVWFISLEQYLRTYADENNIGKIIFVTPEMDK